MPKANVLSIKNSAPVWLRIMSDGLKHDDEQAIVGTIQDVTNKVLSAKLIEHQATFDSLTGLPNRVLYNDRLEKSIEMAKRKEQILAVLFVDLDRFKPINDNHGHQAGDRILIETAHRIKQAIRKSDTVSRLSGDEFAVILNDVKGYQDIRQIAEHIIEKFKRPIASAKFRYIQARASALHYFRTTQTALILYCEKPTRRCMK